MMKWASEAQRRFNNDLSGNVAMIAALSIIPLVIVAGFAIDYQLVTTKKVKAQFSLDAAVIAGSRMMQNNMSEDEVKLGVKNYYVAAMETNEGVLSCEPLTVTINDQDISAATLCSQATTLSAIAGIHEMKFKVNSASKFGTGMVDVAFVFDVSGSMQGSRMTSLKDAAKIAVEQLLPENPAVGHEDDIRLSAVSYNNSLNAGDFFGAATGQSPDQTYTYYSSYYGRYIDVDYTTTCVFQRAGSEKFTDAAPGTNKYMTPASYWDRNDCRDAEPVPLTNDRDTLTNYIDSLDPNGGTAGHLGVAWGWYMISPEWTAELPAAPRGYDEPDTVKAMILMTDGSFNATINNSQGSSTWQAKQLCDNIKNKGVVIYAVAFQAPSSGEDTLNYCSSGPEFFFDPQNGQELAQSYQAIATSISDLRLTQ